MDLVTSHLGKGSFNDYVDQNFPLFDHHLPKVEKRGHLRHHLPYVHVDNSKIHHCIVKDDIKFIFL